MRKATLPQSKSQGKLTDKIPSDTKWTDIEMSLTDKEYQTLDISIKGGKPFTVNCREMGLESDHSHKPLKAWWVLMAFAKAENNEIPTTRKRLSGFAVFVNNTIPSNGKTLFSHIVVLKDALKHSFGIPGNAIPHSEEKNAYETLFRIKDNPYTQEHSQSTQEMDNVKCVGCEELIKKPDHNNVDGKGNYICDNCKETSHDRLSKENEYNNYPDDDE